MLVLDTNVVPTLMQLDHPALTPLFDRDATTDFLATNGIGLIYFTTPDCAVCKVLKPKVLDLMTRRFPRIGLGEVDCAAAPALAARHGVFAVPCLIVFIEGREALRKTRSFGLGELDAALERPYSLFFDD